MAVKPFFGRILLGGQNVRRRQDARPDLFLQNLLAQRAGHFSREYFSELIPLDAALMQESLTSSALGRTGYLPAVFDHICHNRIGETRFRSPWPVLFGEHRTHSHELKGALNRRMNAAINHSR